MSTTLIKTNSQPRTRLNGQSEVAAILNKELCGAENVLGQLRWLGAGEQFDAEQLDATHQLIYLMEGEGTISLNGERYDVTKGAGIYLGPTETASIGHRGAATLKLFHLIVPIREDQQLDE